MRSAMPFSQPQALKPSSGLARQFKSGRRHSREGGNPVMETPVIPALGPRLRGDDDVCLPPQTELPGKAAARTRILADRCAHSDR